MDFINIEQVKQLEEERTNFCCCVCGDTPNQLVQYHIRYFMRRNSRST